MSKPATILTLARQIVQDAAIVDEYFQKNNLPQLTFDENGPPALAPFKDVPTAAAHDRLLQATHQLHLLVLGPLAAIRSLTSTADVDSLTTINHFNIPEHVPLNGGVSLTSLAKASNIPEENLKPIIRHAMTNKVFHEPKPGFIAHTATSRLLATNPLMRAYTELVQTDLALSSDKLIESLENYPASNEPHLSPKSWGLTNKASTPLFSELSTNHPERSTLFATVMDTFASFIPITHTLTSFPWTSLSPSSLVIDVGGGHGPVPVAVSPHFPSLHFIVQDLARTVRAGEESLPAELKQAGKITFQEHDFLSPQKMQGADVFFFRATFHNWPDKYVVEILRALRTGLKPGAKVWIQDPMTFEPENVEGEDPSQGWMQRGALGMSLQMLKLFNSRARTVGEWEGLIKRADERFVVTRVAAVVAAGQPWAMVEVEWEGDGEGV